MLADPQSLAFTSTKFIAAPGNLSLPAVNREGSTSDYQVNPTSNAASKQIDLSVSHSLSAKGRKRSVVRIDTSGLVANALAGVGYQPISGSVYLVIDRPIEQSDALDHTDYKDLVTALVTWLSATSYANTVKFLNGES
jgi:predicted secreted protein